MIRTCSHLPKCLQKTRKKGKGKSQSDRSGSARRTPSPRGKKGGKGVGKMHQAKCYFYNVELCGLGSGCRFGDKCRRSHSRIPDKDFEAPMVGSQSPRPSRSPPSSDTDSKPHGKGSDRNTSRKPANKAILCYGFARDGRCKTKEEGGVCKYPHLTREEVERVAKAKNPKD